MSSLSIFLLAVTLAACATTYALARLAPSEALPPRSVVTLIRVARWLAKPGNARAAIGYAALAAFACFAAWGFLFYPDVAITLAVLTGVAGAISYARG